jgi:hypothetical protein
MKHLKKFRENLDTQIIDNCKDILVDLSDNHIPYKVWVKDKYDFIMIEIGEGDGVVTSLKNMSTTFEHLFSYLESFGYTLNSKKSFYEGDNWEYYECCPNCGNENVILNRDVFTCLKCNASGDSEEFTTPEWPLSKSEFMSTVVRGGQGFNFMILNFFKTL